MAFVDGEPIDAAKLTALETKLNQLSAKIPSFGGDSGSNLGNELPTLPTIKAGNAGVIALEPGKISTLPVTFPGQPFPKNPTVIITTRKGTGTNAWTPEVSIATGSQSPTGFTVVCSMPKSAVAHKVYVNYIAIAY
jgi:hypothetical protein